MEIKLKTTLATETEVAELFRTQNTEGNIHTITMVGTLDKQTNEFVPCTHRDWNEVKHCYQEERAVFYYVENHLAVPMYILLDEPYAKNDYDIINLLTVKKGSSEILGPASPIISTRAVIDFLEIKGSKLIGLCRVVFRDDKINATKEADADESAIETYDTLVGIMTVPEEDKPVIFLFVDEGVGACAAFMLVVSEGLHENNVVESPAYMGRYIKRLSKKDALKIFSTILNSDLLCKPLLTI